MKKHLTRIAVALLVFAGLAVASKAQELDQVVVNIPYAFVVGGKTLPAGSYRVGRVGQLDNHELILSSFENRTGVFIIPVEVETARGADKPSLTFQNVGGEHFLTKIETLEHVFAVHVSQPALLQAAAKQAGSTASSANGTD